MFILVACNLSPESVVIPGLTVIRARELNDIKWAELEIVKNISYLNWIIGLVLLSGFISGLLDLFIAWLNRDNGKWIWENTHFFQHLQKLDDYKDEDEDVAEEDEQQTQADTHQMMIMINDDDTHQRKENELEKMDDAESRLPPVAAPVEFSLSSTNEMNGNENAKDDIL